MNSQTSLSSHTWVVERHWNNHRALYLLPPQTVIFDPSWALALQSSIPDQIPFPCSPVARINLWLLKSLTPPPASLFRWVICLLIPWENEGPRAWFPWASCSLSIYIWCNLFFIFLQARGKKVLLLSQAHSFVCQSSKLISHSFLYFHTFFLY